MPLSEKRLTLTRKAQSATEAVTSSLREKILAGEIQSGERLTEERLAQQLDVSRGPVRAALRRLADEGMVVLVPNRGATVRKVTRQWLNDLFEVRELLEGFAARRAAERLSDADDVRWFREQFAIWSDPATSEDLVAFFDGNWRFHQGLLDRCGNTRLTEFMRWFRPPSLAHFQTFLAQHDAERRRLSANDHKQIAEAILIGDATGAETLARYHIRRTTLLLKDLPDTVFSN